MQEATLPPLAIAAGSPNVRVSVTPTVEMEFRNEIFEWRSETNLITEPEIWDEAGVQLGVKEAG